MRCHICDYSNTVSSVFSSGLSKPHTKIVIDPVTGNELCMDCKLSIERAIYNSEQSYQQKDEDNA